MNDVSKKVEKSLHISQDVIAQIVTNSVNEIEGVYGIAPVMKTPRQLWFRQENFGNIRIGLVDDVLSVSIGIILCRGAKAVSVAEEIQDKVKSAVQNMLGLTVERIPKINLAILRLAIYEAIYEENVPVNVAISEAVALAGKYALEPDVSFVNGVLGSFAKEQEEKQ